MADRAVRIRLLAMFVLLGYLGIIAASHFVPLPPSLEVPLVLVGWLFLPGLFVWGTLRRVDLSRHAYPPARDMLRPLTLTVAFGAVAVVALFLAIGWDVPEVCGGAPLACVKGYQWSTDNGLYYHTTADGIHAEIGQQTYVQEVGAHLRSTAAFGVGALCLAFVAAAVVRRPPKALDL
jgi:hypothetical protein